MKRIILGFYCFIFIIKCSAQKMDAIVRDCYFIKCSSSDNFKRPSSFYWNSDSSIYSYSMIGNSFVNFSCEADSLSIFDLDKQLVNILKSNVKISLDFSLSLVREIDTLGYNLFVLKLFSNGPSGFPGNYYLFSMGHGMLGFRNGFGIFVNPYFDDKELVCKLIKKRS